MTLPPGLEGVTAVIFDVDGVLLDARPSYHAVAEEAALGPEPTLPIPFIADPYLSSRTQYEDPIIRD